MRSLLVFIILFLYATAAEAGGFQVSDHSARAMSLGGALVAAPNDASSVYANPSAMSFLSGTHLSVGTLIMVPEYKFTLSSDPGRTWKTQSQVLFPPNVALTHTFGGGLAFGVSVAVPFSVKNDWGADWPANRVTTGSEIRVLFVSPTVSARILPSLSLGASLNVTFSHLRSSRRIVHDVPPNGVGIVNNGNQILDGSGKTRFGFTAGFLFHPSAVWSLGAAYRSRISIPVENGNVTFDGIPAPVASKWPNSTFSTTMTIPDHVSGGIGIRPFEGLYLGGEVQYMYWSALSSMALAFGDAALTGNPNVEKNLPLNWKNSFTARTGIEITVGDVSLRAGYCYEQTPVPDEYMRPSIPDANRRSISGGIGYAVSADLRLDFACSFVKYAERLVANSLVEYLPGEYLNGTYASALTMIGINMSYSWD